MLYRFEKGNPKGICRVKGVQIAWYDMEHAGDCFDEDFTSISLPAEHILAYVETEEDKNKKERSRVFVHMDDGDIYELTMKKVDSTCNNFYDSGTKKVSWIETIKVSWFRKLFDARQRKERSK